MGRFLRKPLREKQQSFAFRLIRSVRGAAWPIRLPGGDWWLAQNDELSASLLIGEFENGERLLLERLLQPGMTVLDIGAHHGLYTLLASRKVGGKGRVFSFEPSERERKRLATHLRLNFRSNVSIEPCALGAEGGMAQLFLPDETQSVLNSLRPPQTDSCARRAWVTVVSLDEFLAQRNVAKVDFIKMDVEGGELDVFRGAERTLTQRPRPMILAEVSDRRTRPWGYAARELLAFLVTRGFSWFSVESSGALLRADLSANEFDANYLAVPEECVREVSLG
jgi:FkbM family methyltransferase